MGFKHLKMRITAVLIGIFLFLVLLECGLRLGGCVLLLFREYRDKQLVVQKGIYKIMCIGESTTALGGKNSYPAWLEEVLNKTNIGIKFTVINKGREAVNTGAIMAELEGYLNKYTPNMIIAMMGVNDGRIYGNISIADKFSFKTYKLVKLLYYNLAEKYRNKKIKKGERKKQKYYNTVEDSLEIDLKSWYGFADKEWFYKKEKWCVEVEKKLKSSLKIDSESNRMMLELGLWYYIRGDYTKGREMLRKYIEINPECDRGYFYLGWGYTQQRRYEEAVRILKKALQINPENDLVCLKLGEIYRERLQYSKAEQMFKKALEIDSMNEKIYLELVDMYTSNGFYDKAIGILNEAIKVNLESAEIYGGLASLHRKLNNHKLAEQFFAQANRLRLNRYNLITYQSYQQLKEIVVLRGIKLVCVQYPMRSIEPLKKMLKPYGDDIIFVDNEKVFKEAVEREGYKEYFIDMFGGDFGHCTKKGNKLLAENIAGVILEKVFSHNR